MRDNAHKEIARWLWDNYSHKGVSGWWCQMITVGYEKHHGKRVTGQTASQGIEIGVRKTINAKKAAVWKFVISAAGTRIWMGEGVVKFTPGKPYKTADVRGEVRTIKAGERVRLTYQPKGWEKPSTLQLYFEPTGNKTALAFHQEKLPSLKMRVEMKKHWQMVLNKIEEKIHD